MVFHMTEAANAVEAFRLRIRGEGVGVHDRIHPSFPVPWCETLFNFCTLDFEPDAERFLARCQVAIAETQAASRLLLDEPQRDDMIFLSCVPWFSFTSATHPVDVRSGDSIPRISWGRTIERDGRTLMPVNLQLHHGLADGLHVAQFLEALQASLACQARPTGLR
jgi:chloramphenicol O-acetyltransferase type A